LVIQLDYDGFGATEMTFIVLALVLCSLASVLLWLRHCSPDGAGGGCAYSAYCACTCCVSAGSTDYFRVSVENGVVLERRDAIKHCFFIAILLGSINSFNTTIVSGICVPIMNQFFGCAGQESVQVLEGLLVACILLGGFFGSLVAPHIADKLGRPDAIVVCGIVATLFPTLVAAFEPTSFAVLVVLRTFLGVCLGMSTVLGPLYIAERSPADIRGRIGTLYQVMVCTFVLIAQLLNYWCNPESLERLDPPIIQFQLGISAVLGALLIVYGLFGLPDIAPRPGSDDMVPLAARAEDGSLVHAIDLVGDESASFFQALKRIEFRWWVLIIVLPATQQLTGINAVVLYGPRIIKNGGFSNFLLITFLCIGLWNLLSVFVSTALIERVGRRTLMLFALSGMSVSLLGLGVIFAVLPMAHPAKGTSALLCIMSYLFFFEVGPGPLFFVMATESFPERIKSNALALANAGTWIYNILVVFLFPPLTSAFGDPKEPKEGDTMPGTATMFIAFAVVSVGCLFVIWRKVPSRK
jgi:SP family arabinose:H+ symporter-like MFS transporter